MRALFPLLIGCATAAAECPASGTRLMVDASARQLLLCEDGKAAHQYRVALGRGGLEKRHQGDLRTPIGEYSLAPGRTSSQFHTFLAVGYPTADERARGFTGGDIGVHGPGRSFRLLGPLSTMSDWTAGCIAVASDGEIDEIASWANQHGARSILIRK
jgi:murein L,D-transpeptidase YafK